MERKDEVLNALKKVIDPEIGFNIVDLGLIYGIKENEGNVNIDMTLSTPSCPLSGTILSWVESEVKKLPWVKDVEINLVWNPPWTIDRASENVKKALGVI